MNRRTLTALALAALLLPWGDFTDGNTGQNEAQAQSRRGRRPARQRQQPQTHQAGFFVVGTDVVFDDFGVPVEIFGALLNERGRWIGQYHETIEPVFHSDFGFIGTVGFSTFTFTNWNGRRVHGTVVTQNASTLEGFDFGGGVWLINSTGVVVNGTGLFRNAVGGVSSHSGILFDDFFVLDPELTIAFSQRFNGRQFGFRRVADLPDDPGDIGGGDIPPPPDGGGLQ